eukprot:204551_1
MSENTTNKGRTIVPVSDPDDEGLEVYYLSRYDILKRIFSDVAFVVSMVSQIILHIIYAKKIESVGMAILVIIDVFLSIILGYFYYLTARFWLVQNAFPRPKPVEFVTTEKGILGIDCLCMLFSMRYIWILRDLIWSTANFNLNLGLIVMGKNKFGKGLSVSGYVLCTIFGLLALKTFIMDVIMRPKKYILKFDEFQSKHYKWYFIEWTQFMLLIPCVTIPE